MRILASVAQASLPLSIEDLMHEIGTSLAVTRRAVRALEMEGFIVTDTQDGRYSISSRFLHLASLARSNYRLEQEIRPLLRELTRRTGETVTFNIYEAGATHAVCVLVEQSPAPLHYVVEVGERKPLHAGASGKAILAHLPEEAIRSYITETGLPPVTARTSTDPNKLLRELKRIRKQGYTLTRGQRLEGAVAIAGTVFAGHVVHASLVVTIPAHRYHSADRARLVDCVVTTAQAISHLLDTRKS